MWKYKKEGKMGVGFRWEAPPTRLPGENLNDVKKKAVATVDCTTYLV